MAYIYDPSQNIQQGLQQAASGVGNIFTQVIAQQQRDYNLAENAFQNIEALKKNLNIFGQKSITSKANDLLGKTSSAIMKNGKLDYSALGDIRQQVSEIGDLKQGYDVGAKEYERMLQLGVANKDNLVSFEKFYKDLSAKMGDENLVKNPQDLQKALADTYTNNLDSFKMFGKSYLSSNPYQKIAQDVRDPKTGALMRVQGELPAGWTLDAQGNKIPPAPKTMVVNGQTVTMDYADQELARIQATSPEQLLLMRKQAGFAGQNLSDKEIVKASIDKIPMTVQSTQVKSKDDLRREAAQAQSSEFEAATAPQKLSAQLGQMRASTNLTNTQAALAREQLKMYEQPQTLTDYKKFGIQFDDNGARLNLGGSVAFDLVKPDGTTMKVGASEIYSKGGKKYLKYYVPNASKDLDEQIRTGFQGSTAKEIPLPDDFAQSQTYTNLQNALMGNKTGKKALLSNALKYLPSAIDGYKPSGSSANPLPKAKYGKYKGADLDIMVGNNPGVSLDVLKAEVDRITEGK
jgi:hypothetical protein